MKLEEFIKNLETPGKLSSPKIMGLEAVLDIFKKINSSLILNDVLESVLKNAIDISQSERGFIVLSNEKNNLEFVLCLDSEGKPLPQELFEISTTVVDGVFSSGQSKFIESALDDTKKASQSIINLELQTIMCSPLVTKGEKIGVIYVDSRRINKIDKKEITGIFEILAGQAGIAINNALMHQRQLSANDELKRAYQDLELAKREAEKFEELKNHFLLQMSHEIRTPFNIILGSTELLRLNNLPLDSSEIKELFEMLEHGSRRIIRTIDKMMEMSKIRSGNYEIKPEEINLEKDILTEVMDKYEPSALEKGILFSYANSTETDKITCDKFMIYQIFQELVDNAIKFTRSGKIIVRKYVNADKKLCVSVKDTGVGISPEYLDFIFSPFSQEDTGYSRKFEGNGLALALVKKYAEMNNLSVDVISKKNRGSEFIITFN
ncbi:MAG: hypothetical protein CVV24_14690 [Ignavibacteriae bacterium HGW-Ignavibacteriae-3]|nr:MAG: hypothetical protein CVV24_14690 [Ignavibacteriae bacterium HGW-Ignavibacteriae-3]